MSLVGTLKDGTRVEAQPTCDFDREDGSGRDCGDYARYRVTLPNGATFFACESHAQSIWDAEIIQSAVPQNGETTHD